MHLRRRLTSIGFFVCLLLNVSLAPAAIAAADATVANSTTTTTQAGLVPPPPPPTAAASSVVPPRTPTPKSGGSSSSDTGVQIIGRSGDDPSSAAPQGSEGSLSGTEIAIASVAVFVVGVIAAVAAGFYRMRVHHSQSDSEGEESDSDASTCDEEEEANDAPTGSPARPRSLIHRLGLGGRRRRPSAAAPRIGAVGSPNEPFAELVPFPPVTPTAGATAVAAAEDVNELPQYPPTYDEQHAHGFNHHDGVESV